MRGHFSPGLMRLLVVLTSATAFACTTTPKIKAKFSAKQTTPPKTNSLSPLLPDGTEEDVWQSIVREADANQIKDVVPESVHDEYCNEFGSNHRDDLAWDMAFGDHELQVAMSKENERLEAASIQAAHLGAPGDGGSAAGNYCIPPITPDKFADGIGE